MGMVEATDETNAMNTIEAEVLAAYPGRIIKSCRIHAFSKDTGRCEAPCFVLTDGDAPAVPLLENKSEAKKPVAGKTSHAREETKGYKTAKSQIEWSTPVCPPRPVVTMILKETTDA